MKNEIKCTIPDGLEGEISHVLNKHSAENGSNTPDFLLAEYLMACLLAFNQAIDRRAQWYGKDDSDEQKPTE